MARVLIEGSSSAYGLWGGPAGGWGDRLKSSFMNVAERNRFASVANLAMPLRTVETIAQTLPANMDAYRGSSAARIALFMVGLSESRLLKGTNAVSPEIFERSLRQITTISNAHGFTPMYVGMPPINESRTHHFGWENAFYTETERNHYDGIMYDHTVESGVRYIDIASELAGKYPDTEEILDRDGLHMNAIGHAAIHDILFPIVEEELLRLKSAPRLKVASEPELVG